MAQGKFPKRLRFKNVDRNPKPKDPSAPAPQKMPRGTNKFPKHFRFKNVNLNPRPIPKTPPAEPASSQPAGITYAPRVTTGVLEIWYAIPSANKARAEQCFEKWQSKGFHLAVLVDPGAVAPRQAELVYRPAQYPGYFSAVNLLAKEITKRLGRPPDILVTGGDDMFPDPNHTAHEIAAQFLGRFPDGFGVMQPTGDSLAGTSQICGSPWFGRGWLERAYGGRGPFFSDYFAFYGDEELKVVSERLDVLWQRPDLTQKHDHFLRPGGPPRQAYQLQNQNKYWSRDQQIFVRRREAGWPNSDPLPKRAVTFDILICTLHSRKAMLSTLLVELDRQCRQFAGRVRVLSAVDDGELTIGEKRQKLLQEATGDYVAFVDDDDRVSANYVERIVEALASSPDCVGFQGTYTVDGKTPAPFEHSLRHKEWYTKGGTHYRSPNHLNPVRRDLALQAGFPSIRHGEDHAYSRNLLPFLKTETFLEGPVYFYDFRSRK